MPLFVKLGESASSHRSPLDMDPLRALCDKFPFLPGPESLVPPAGWFELLAPMARRLSCVVPPAEWGHRFKVTSVGEKDGALAVATVGGNAQVQAVVRKMRRASMAICPECGTPAVPFRGKQGLRPHCPRCLQLPVLLRDLDTVLGWRAGIEGSGGMGIQTRRIPRTLRASFRQWLEASGFDPRELQPWDLEVWMRDLARAQKTLRRAYS